MLSGLYSFWCLPPQTLQICAVEKWKALQTVTKGWRAELVITYYNKGCIPLPRQKIPSALCMSWVPGLRRTSGPSIISDIFLGTSRRYLTISSYCNLCKFDVPTSGQKQIYCHSWRSLSITGSCSWVRGKWSSRSTNGLVQCQQWCGLCSGEERAEHQRKTVDSLVELCSYTHLAVVSERIRLWILWKLASSYGCLGSEMGWGAGHVGLGEEQILLHIKRS